MDGVCAKSSKIAVALLLQTTESWRQLHLWLVPDVDVASTPSEGLEIDV